MVIFQRPLHAQAAGAYEQFQHMLGNARLIVLSSTGTCTHVSFLQPGYLRGSASTWRAYTLLTFSQRVLVHNRPLGESRRRTTERVFISRSRGFR
mmetsp:Transcript_43884/g.115328  ORF Transcript_43884/g.115328 Transcript_43884/m.115328 type:complete len:95 (+) Transcript_43884:270-554(+)